MATRCGPVPRGPATASVTRIAIAAAAATIAPQRVPVASSLDRTLVVTAGTIAESGLLIVVGAMKRYPRRGTVWMYVGASALSPSTSRICRIQVLSP